MHTNTEFKWLMQKTSICTGIPTGHKRECIYLCKVCRHFSILHQQNVKILVIFLSFSPLAVHRIQNITEMGPQPFWGGVPANDRSQRNSKWPGGRAGEGNQYKKPHRHSWQTLPAASQRQTQRFVYMAKPLRNTNVKQAPWLATEELRFLSGCCQATESLLTFYQKLANGYQPSSPGENPAWMKKSCSFLCTPFWSGK